LRQVPGALHELYARAARQAATRLYFFTSAVASLGGAALAAAVLICGNF
jgi:hypothetical protein